MMAQASTDHGEAAGPRYGGFWRRVVAALIDSIIVNAALVPLSFVLPIYETIGQGDATVTESAMGIGAELEYTPLGTLILVIGTWLYVAFMESGPRQATLGKMALSMQVTDIDGDRITFSQATGRYFAKFLSGAILMIGFLMVAFTPRKQGLHDILAKTLVIRRPWR
ncbi:putative protein YxaI [Hypericibacter terrae]|jgi:uncharacterized RDD family membrane protein YckC|uniref:RDD domain-containing protein n=1 Tax=Hypericibacter terrae TaxID=2602015 RepID=A0A5J6MPS6_9PROT|nr:RDD family protein [Hypericibacter terrae]QEX19588.1 putative protein YxaI [Hypericibacter terrae]